MKVSKRLLTKALGIPLAVVICSLIGITLLGFYAEAHTKAPISTVSNMDTQAPIKEATPIVVPPLDTSNVTPYTAYTPPKLPYAPEDPTLAWTDKNEYLFNKFSDYSQLINSAIGGCATSNPDYNSMCVDYDGSSVLPVCTSLATDVTTAQVLPAIPYAPANTSWQNALISFQSAAQTCISKINAHSYVGTSTDVGYTIGPSLNKGVQYLISTENALIAHQKTL